MLQATYLKKWSLENITNLKIKGQLTLHYSCPFKKEKKSYEAHWLC